MSAYRVSRSSAYQLRAEECRTVAERFRNGETRCRLLQIADDFERLAMQAATLEIQLQEIAASLPRH